MRQRRGESARGRQPGDLGLGTVMRSNRADGLCIITTWFRHAFVLSDQPAAFAYLTATSLRNDGAVVYLNGAEILRDNMPAGPGDSQTLAVNSAPALARITNPPDGTNAVVSWPGAPGAQYFLEAATNLAAVSRFGLQATNLVGQAGTNTFTDINAASRSPRFYRLGVE